jgi:transmembrane sensor
MTARPAPDHDTADAPLAPAQEAALEWLVRLHDGTATDADWTAYEAWQSENPDHMIAAGRAEQIWESLGQAVKRPKAATRRGLGLLVVCAGLGLSALLMGGPWPGALLADQRTTAGETRRLTLADGSLLALDAATSVDIDITPTHRRLVLHRGALHVQVAPDAAHPFEVIAAGGRTRALGTAFDVRRLSDDEVRVAVTEHAVRVIYPTEDTKRDVAEGQMLRYGPQFGLGPAYDADLQSITAWQRGKLVFDRMPLGKVVEEMERYRRGYIFIADTALRELPVTGVFDTNDSEGLLQAIAATLPVRIRALPYAVLITAQPTDVKKPAD